jgi:hypothetical protein
MAMDEINFEVEGLPPAKSEAISMLGAGHGHAERVLELLRVARDEAKTHDFEGFGLAWIGLEVTVSCGRGPSRSDATNYLGGIGDVLEDKSRRGTLDHLGELATFGLYDNDRQIEEVAYHWQPSADPSYAVRLWRLAS